RLREALELQPDLVVIAFGWNDVAEVAGAADKDYPLPHPLMLQLQRLLLGTHTVRWLLSLRPAAAPPTGFGLHPRVALADYRSNLQRMVELARGAGAGAILSTRSHRIVYPAPNWRYRVKDYNAAVFQVARASDVPLIDAQAMVIERPELLADECHFTPAGDRVFAEQLAAVIRQMIEGGRGQDVLYWESARRSTIRNKLVTGAGGGRRSLVRLLETR
ncbi:MAG TPA: GDSL-type esterase/lipase family protein, partial [Acidobacteriota bacterium]